jgi:hypothetical protein
MSLLLFPLGKAIKLNYLKEKQINKQIVYSPTNPAGSCMCIIKTAV